MLASRNPAKIYITGRNEAAAQKTIAEIKASELGGSSTTLEWIRCDHTSLVSIKKAADKILANESRLDVLMANAGIMAHPPGLVSIVLKLFLPPTGVFRLRVSIVEAHLVDEFVGLGRNGGCSKDPNHEKCFDTLCWFLD